MHSKEFLEPMKTNIKGSSKLYIINGNDGSEVYTWNSERFVLFTVNDYSPTPDEPESDIVNIGRVDYMTLTE